jgi:hypothetical protein
MRELTGDEIELVAGGIIGGGSTGNVPTGGGVISGNTANTTGGDGGIGGAGGAGGAGGTATAGDHLTPTRRRTGLTR